MCLATSAQVASGKVRHKRHAKWLAMAVSPSSTMTLSNGKLGKSVCGKKPINHPKPPPRCIPFENWCHAWIRGVSGLMQGIEAVTKSIRAAMNGITDKNV